MKMLSDISGTKHAIRDYLDRRFEDLHPGSALLISGEMLDEAFAGWLQAREWYLAKNGVLTPFGNADFRLRKRGNDD